jgi:hypothetical protein
MQPQPQAAILLAQPAALNTASESSMATLPQEIVTPEIESGEEINQRIRQLLGFWGAFPFPVNLDWGRLLTI